MIVRAVCTGDELLDGRVRDLNIWAMGKMLAERGLRLDRVILVDDALEAIEGAIASSSQGCDLVLVTGGLGPTSDDRTRDAIASLRSDSLSRNWTAVFRSSSLIVLENTRRNISDASISLVLSDAASLAAYPSSAVSFRWISVELTSSSA